VTGRWCSSFQGGAAAWGRGLDDQSWRIVRDHAHGFSERAIADRVHIPASAVARRYDAAITMVVQAALAAD
jgi:hypothetical protein